jgi:hypothetical protein
MSCTHHYMSKEGPCMESMESLRERVEALEYRAHLTERRLRWWRALTCGAVVLSLYSLPLASGKAQEESAAKPPKLEQRVAALEYKLAHVEGGENEVVISGANLRIVNGLGATNTTNGLGNLIVGYNELRNNPAFPPDVHTGSHNVVLGRGNNFLSFGGLVGGETNEISGEFSSISTGGSNTASGFRAWIGGGVNNTASGNDSSVSGGALNTAGGIRHTSVCGGIGNVASREQSSVCGGQNNTASSFRASVSGGRFNEASGDFSSVSGGNNRTAPGEDDWAAGPLFADF